MGQKYRIHPQIMIHQLVQSIDQIVDIFIMKLHPIQQLTVFAFILYTVLAWNMQSNPFRAEQSVGNVNQQVQYFDQVLDHFSYLPPEMWKQRYFVDDSHFGHHSGPVILVLCGEGPCGGVSENSWVGKIAQENQALIISLEHRYYGQSLPFRTLSFETNNLRYLSSRQALRDIAFFIEQVKRNKWYGISPVNKWITIGGSYSGALSAWFRAKYPHLTVGAIASSAVILAVQDFKDFDEQIYLSSAKSGVECVEAIRQLTDYAEEKVLGPDRIEFQKQFNAQQLTSREFMFYWSDVIVFQVQYGNRTNFCTSIKGKLVSEMFNVFKSIILRVSPWDYGAYYLSQPQLELDRRGGGRPWYYQSCTEFSYFQTFSEKHPMRSKMLTIDFYRKWCEDIYGIGTWPNVKDTNNEFGGLHMRATNLLITNGVQDPWKWASLQSNYKNITSKVIDCTNCAHCRDLRTPDKHDPKQVTDIHTLELSLIKQWLK